MRSVSVEELVAWEVERFQANEYRGRADAPEFEFEGGHIPVLVSAPHAVTHVRDGAVKPSEDFMGAIALAVAHAAECHALVATRTGNGDPNWDPLEKSPYKQALCKYVAEHGIELVLDLHGMVAASEDLVAIGSADGATVVDGWGGGGSEGAGGGGGAGVNTGVGASGGSSAGGNAGGGAIISQSAGKRFDEHVHDVLCSRLEPWCGKYGKPIALNGRLGARSESTIARTVARECHVTALQIEVATQLRVPANLGGHVPKGEKIPFSNKQLPVEIAARRAADPEGVIALVESLAAICRGI